MEWIVPIVFGVALAAPALQRALGARAGYALALVPGSVALYAVALQRSVAGGAFETFRAPWIPSLGLDWAFRVDGLANLFVLLISGIGALIVVYASHYLREHTRLGRFYSFLFAFMAGMLGVATADDLLLLFVFWEVTTISSFLLIGFDESREEARTAARQALLVTAAGGLALLAGFVLLAGVAGTTSISELAAQGETIRAHRHYPWIFGLILAGALTKSAQFPFHFWLPAAMQAPTPVSAYLHSSTMVKAGVFVLARFSPVLGGTDTWYVALTGIGATTMVIGALATLGQDDLKRLLAYSTISVLGLLTLLLGLGTPIAARAFAVTLFAHALYKGTLFLVAGNLDHATGTRSLARLGGLRRAMPWTAAVASVAGISMAGAPPLFGFLAKETAYEAVLEAPRWASVLAPATILTALCLVFAALRVGLQPFAGPPGEAAACAHDPGLALGVAPAVLAALGLLAGFLLGPAESFLIAPAALALGQEQMPTGLALWHGFTPILALSTATLVAGVLLYAGRERFTGCTARLRPGRFGPARVWALGWQGVLTLASRQTRVLQSGSLRGYLAVTLATAIAAVTWGLMSLGALPEATGGPPLSSVAARPVCVLRFCPLFFALPNSRSR